MLLRTSYLEQNNQKPQQSLLRLLSKLTIVSISELSNRKVSISLGLILPRARTRIKEKDLKQLHISYSQQSLTPFKGKGKSRKKKWITKEKRSYTSNIASQAIQQASIQRILKEKGLYKGFTQQKRKSNKSRQIGKQVYKKKLLMPSRKLGNYSTYLSWRIPLKKS